MALIETLTLQLGPALAKGILKVWLKDDPISYSGSSSMVDLIKSKLTNIRSQKQAERQLEEIGEKVADSLLQVFDFEQEQFDDNGREAILREVAETLQKAEIDPKLLTRIHLEPERLYQHFLTTRLDAARDFSETETRLYERILEESAQRITDIASQLPGFTEKVFAGVLQGNQKLIEIAQQILEEFRRI